MIFGVSPTRDAVVVARAAGTGKTFVIKSITWIPFHARSGADLRALRKRLVVMFDRGGKKRRSTIALLGSSSGRFKSSIEAIKAEAITELAAAESGLPVTKVTAASLKKALGCSAGQKWQARAAERFNPAGRHENWSRGAAGATAAALKVADQPSS
jgi:ethanolamine utilization protein EutA (predicted chaperonin)